MTGNERGITLTEVTVITVLASLVMVGLVTFYLNSQATWIDASGQAIAQREATTLIEVLASHVQESSAATISPSPDVEHSELILQKPDGTQHSFFWNEQDRRIHERNDLGSDLGPVVTSEIEKFELDTNGALVIVRNLHLRSTNAHSVKMATTLLLYNR